MFDLFGAGQAVYRVRSRIDELPDFDYDDGRTTYFLNSKYKVPNTVDAVTEFLDCVNGEEQNHESGLAQMTVDMLDRVRYDKEREEMYMTISMKLQDSFNEGRAAGHALGRAEGRAGGRAEGQQIHLVKKQQEDFASAGAESSFDYDPCFLGVKLTKPL